MSADSKVDISLSKRCFLQRQNRLASTKFMNICPKMPMLAPPLLRCKTNMQGAALSLFLLAGAGHLKRRRIYQSI
jgi:hypothetical protein